MGGLLLVEQEVTVCVSWPLLVQVTLVLTATLWLEGLYPQSVAVAHVPAGVSKMEIGLPAGGVRTPERKSAVTTITMTTTAASTIHIVLLFGFGASLFGFDASAGLDCSISFTVQRQPKTCCYKDCSGTLHTKPVECDTRNRLNTGENSELWA